MNRSEAPKQLDPVYVKQANRVYNATHDTAVWMMETFFPANTWGVRQLATYGLLITEPVTQETQVYDPSDGMKHMVGQIFNDLGDRTRYFEAAYKIPDGLNLVAANAALVQNTKHMLLAWTNPDREAIRILKRGKSWLDDLTPKLEHFLKKEAKHAFSITFDLARLTYQIDGLTLHPEDIRARWQLLQKAVTTS